MKRKILSAFAALTAFVLFASCSSFDEAEEKADGGTQTAYLKIGVDGERMALPVMDDASAFDTFALTGTADSSDAVSVKQTWESNAEKTAYSKMMAASIAVTPGYTYDFTLCAQKSGAVWKGSVQKKISNGENNIQFSLAFDSLSSEGAGSVSITLSLPAKVKAVSAVFERSDDETDATIPEGTLTFAGEKATYTNESLPSGNYVLVFSLWADEAKTLLLGKWREYAGISNAQTSSSSPKIESDDELESIYEIKVNLDGGTLNGTIPGSYTRYSDEIVLPVAEKVTKDCYDFAGWKWDRGSKTITKIEKGSSGDIKLTATWNPSEYKITYACPDGTTHSNTTDTYTIESDDIELSDAEKPGFTFEGWYDAENGGNKVSKIAAGSFGDRKVYARFVEGIIISVSEVSSLQEKLEAAKKAGLESAKVKISGKLELTPLKSEWDLDSDLLSFLYDADNGERELIEESYSSSIFETIDESLLAVGEVDLKTFTSNGLNVSLDLSELEIPYLPINALFLALNLTEVTLPETVQTILPGALAYTGVKELAIPKSVRSLVSTGKELGAFTGNKYLEKVTIAEGSALKTIGIDTFAKCESLTEISLPASVKEIGGFAFLDCSSLTKLSFGGTSEQWVEVKRASSWHKNIHATTIKCTDKTMSLDSIKMPALSVTLGKFSGDAEVNLKFDDSTMKFTATEGFTEYEWRVDGDVENEKSDTLALGSLYIGWHSLMLIVTDSKGEMYSAEQTFHVEEKKYRVELDCNGGTFFDNGKKTKEIVFPENGWYELPEAEDVERKDYIFKGWYKVTLDEAGKEELDLWDYSYIDSSDFGAQDQGCIKLRAEWTSTVFEMTIESDFDFNSLSEILSEAEDDGMKTAILKFKGLTDSAEPPEDWSGTNLSQYTDVRFAIVSDAIYNAKDLEVKIDLSASSLTYIPFVAFCLDQNSLSNLTEVTLPDTVTVILPAAFYCTGITEITIPASVTMIEISAFEDCTSLETIIFEGTKAQWKAISLAQDWNVGALATEVTCSDGTVELEDDIPEAVIPEQGIAQLDTILTQGVENGYKKVGLTITGLEDAKTPPEDWSGTNLSQYTDVRFAIVASAIYNAKDLEVKLDLSASSLTYIPWGAFFLSAGAVSNLTEVILPDTVTAILDGAFVYTGIKKITIPASVKHIGSDAFLRCTSLETIIFEGTKAQWKAISLAQDWNVGVLAKKVICSDGDIEF